MADRLEVCEKETETHPYPFQVKAAGTSFHRVRRGHSGRSNPVRSPQAGRVHTTLPVVADAAATDIDSSHAAGQQASRAYRVKWSASQPAQDTAPTQLYANYGYGTIEERARLPLTSDSDAFAIVRTQSDEKELTSEREEDGGCRSQLRDAARDWLPGGLGQNLLRKINRRSVSDGRGRQAISPVPTPVSLPRGDRPPAARQKYARPGTGERGRAWRARCRIGRKRAPRLPCCGVCAARAPKTGRAVSEMSAAGFARFVRAGCLGPWPARSERPGARA